MSADVGAGVGHGERDGRTPSSAPIRVLLADDQALVRGALAALLEMEEDITVVAQLADGTDVTRTVAELAVDVALLDIEMPGLDGIQAVHALQDAGLVDCRCLMVTTFGRPGYLRRAMEAGAAGFVVKDTPAEQLAQAVRTVHRGGRVVDPSLAQESLVAGASPLTDREREVLRAALDGATVREIAAQLFLSPGTVRNHLSAGISKTGTSNRTEAAVTARDRGWL